MPRTRPKQWNKGGGQHSVSRGVRDRRSPTKRALLRRLWCVSIAALGEPVEPLVNCRLQTSCGLRLSCRSWRSLEGVKKSVSINDSYIWKPLCLLSRRTLYLRYGHSSFAWWEARYVNISERSRVPIVEAMNSVLHATLLMLACFLLSLE